MSNNMQQLSDFIFPTAIYRTSSRSLVVQIINKYEVCNNYITLAGSKKRYVSSNYLIYFVAALYR